MDRQAPRVGQHTVEILKEYGYTDEQIEKFLADGSAAGEKEPCL